MILMLVNNVIHSSDKSHPTNNWLARMKIAV